MDSIEYAEWSDEQFLKSMAQPRQDKKNCTHAKCMPEFNEEEAEKMTAKQIREKYPRFQGICPDCGEQLIMYASTKQYIYGDY